MIRRWPFLIPFLLMTGGMVVAFYTGIAGNLTILTATALCAFCACFTPSIRVFATCSGLLFLVAGLYSMNPWLRPEVSISMHVSDQPLTIEGIISDRPSNSPEGSRVTVQVEHIVWPDIVVAASGKMLLYVSNGDITLSRGDRIRFNSRVAVPHRLGLPGEFDYTRYLAFRGITATGRVRSQNEIVLMRGAADESLQRMLDRSALRLGESIRHALPDEQTSSVLTALLLGDQRRIPRELAASYTRAGVNHILSISGFHIGIISAFISVLMVRLLTRLEYVAVRCDARRIAVLIAVPTMILYLFLTGNAPATARSVLMLAVFAGAFFSEREQEPINSLLIAAFFLVAIHPPNLFDVSFQLSFLSLWGILTVVPMIFTLFPPVESRWLRYLLQFVVASVAASCVTLVPVLYFFNVASFNGILTNFLIVPLLGYGAVLTGFAALPVIAAFPGLSPLVLWPSAILVRISNRFIIWCDSLPVFSFYGVTAVDMAFFLLFMCCITFIKNRRFLTVTSLLIPVSAVAFHLAVIPQHDGRLHITMLSVGQAESLLVTLPDGSTLLVDGGGYLYDNGYDFGQRILAPALGALHVGRIDRVIATHSHPDHSGGLPFVIRNFPVGELWSGADIASDVQDELNRKQLPHRILAAGDRITLPGRVTLTVLSPSVTGNAQKTVNESRVNEESLVFRLSYGSFSMLFCADAGFEAEEHIMADHKDLKSTVLKIGHHGSRHSTSKAFLDRVNPEYAFISAGAGNRFGLPTPRTTDLLRSRGIAVYRTDCDGTIELVTNGASWRVATPFKTE